MKYLLLILLLLLPITTTKVQDYLYCQANRVVFKPKPIKLPVERLEEGLIVGIPEYPFKDKSSPAITQKVKQEDLECLSLTVYHEARSEPERVQKLIANVVMNRVNHKAFPSSVCEVVKQQRKGVYQFSYWKEAKSLEMKEKKAREKAYKIAEEALTKGYSLTPSLWFVLCDHPSSFHEKQVFRGAVGKTCFYAQRGDV